MTTLREHLRCGLHSGFPRCCVAWYLTGWQAMCALDERIGETIELDNGRIRMTVSGLSVTYLDRASARLGRPHGYVPCPLCLLRRRALTPAEIRACDCDVDARMRA